MDDWVPIEGFPKYSVNSLGQVRKDSTGHILKPKQNQSGAAYVGLMRENWNQCQRSLAKIVAKTFMPELETEIFDTPINLNGDRLDCSVLNLMWRPRWFAILYHQQFKAIDHGIDSPPVIDTETHEIYPSILSVVKKYGLLYRDVYLSIGNRTYVWPTYQKFDWAEH